jgi:UDP-4-amino-4,6-dideoxy-N-acetyl-beta-L-altrosamine transaminase
VIPYGRQSIADDDVEAVVAVLRSDFLTQGPAVPAFERAVAERVGAAHAVACSSATAALHLACAALGLGPGDLLWTSPITFVASANCARYCGADVDFVDIDPRTWTMCPEALERKLDEAAARGRLPKVIVPVHLCGQPADMTAIAALARRHGVRVIEDASHAIGASHRGVPVGAGLHADVVVFSFHPVKIVTTGEGGMALTDDPELAKTMAMLRSHGLVRDPADMVEPPEGPWVYEQQALGWNYRLTDLQAALGSSQLGRLDAFLARRRALAARYDERLAGLPIERPWLRPQDTSSWHLYVVGIDAARCGIDRRGAYDAMRAAGFGVQVHYAPVHLQPYYRALGFAPGDFPQAERYASRALTLPLHPSLTDAQLDAAADALRDAVSR